MLNLHTKTIKSNLTIRRSELQLISNPKIYVNDMAFSYDENSNAGQRIRELLCHTKCLLMEITQRKLELL